VSNTPILLVLLHVYFTMLTTSLNIVVSTTHGISNIFLLQESLAKSLFPIFLYRIIIVSKLANLL